MDRRSSRRSKQQTEQAIFNAVLAQSAASAPSPSTPSLPGGNHQINLLQALGSTNAVLAFKYREVTSFPYEACVP
jgi:hypothetical protein